MSDRTKTINLFDFSQSEHCTLSIRLKADGFSFSIFEPKESINYTYDLKIDSSLSLTANLKKTFQEEDFINKPYLQKRIIYGGLRYIILPLELFEDEQKESLFYHSHIKKENETIKYDIIKDNNLVVLYAMDTSAYKYLNEWDQEVDIQSQPGLLIEKLSKINQSSQKKQLFIDIQKSRVSIYSFEKGNLLANNAFNIQSYDDVLYYSLYLWKQLNFNQLEDELIILKKSESDQSLIPEFNKYINKIDFLAMDRLFEQS